MIPPYFRAFLAAALSIGLVATAASHSVAQSAPRTSKEVPVGHPAHPGERAAGEDPVPRGDKTAGCGFRSEDRRSCWRPTKAGRGAAPRCADADLASDPWLESSRATARPLRDHPRWHLERVRSAGNRRYGWQDPRPAGYWPLGGPVGEPWAESLSTLAANLRWACENLKRLPPELRGRMGSPATHDMELHPREVYDLVFLGGAREMHEGIKRARGAAEPGKRPAPLGATSLEAEITWHPAEPRVGEEVIFLAADQGPGATYHWWVEGRRRSGPHVPWTFREAGDAAVRLQVRHAGRRATRLRHLEVAPSGPDPSLRSRREPAAPRGAATPSPQPGACPAGIDCTYRWREDLGRHEVRHFRPSRRSTGNLELEILAVPEAAAPGGGGGAPPPEAAAPSGGGLRARRSVPSFPRRRPPGRSSPPLPRCP